MKLLKGNKIQSLDNTVSKEPSLIPKKSFIGLISASRGSGKSVMLCNLLLNKDMLCQKFNQIFWISPTNKLDKKLSLLKTTPNITVLNKKLLKRIKETKKGKHNIFDTEVETIDSEKNIYIPEENFMDDISEEFLNNLIAQQTKVIERYPDKADEDIADDILIVYDDTIANKKFWSSSSVQRAIFNSRHFKISIIITTQSYMKLPKALREQMSFLVLFFTANEKELKNIYEENTCSTSFKNFIEIYNDTCGKPFNFLVINYQNPSTHRLQNAFEEFIQI